MINLQKNSYSFLLSRCKVRLKREVDILGVRILNVFVIGSLTS
nr:MAG TPA: hypothetical protein [Caudoviricetes sp.]